MPRFKRILFPVDFSERSRAAAPFVLSMAQRYQAHVVLIHVLQPPMPIYAGMGMIYDEGIDFKSLSADLRAELQKFAESELPKVEVTCVAEPGDAAAAISQYAADEKIDLIAMPTHGYGPFRRALLGSVTAKILHDVNVPVWTAAHAPEASHRAHPQPRHILCAIDLKPESRHTLEFAIELAGDTEATVEVVYAAHEGEVDAVHSERKLQDLLVEAGRTRLVKIEEEPAGSEVQAAVNAGTVAHMVRTVALAKRSDLVVIGRGEIHSTFGRLRANAYSIVREAPCPVLSV
jgi:nucleotide-binding universal stress UspA family protein